jgi:hypothetical protein
MIHLSLFLPFLPFPAVFLNYIPDNGHNGGVLILPPKLQDLLLQEKYHSSVSSMVVFLIFALLPAYTMRFLSLAISL